VDAYFLEANEFDGHQPPIVEHNNRAEGADPERVLTAIKPGKQALEAVH